MKLRPLLSLLLAAFLFLPSGCAPGDTSQEPDPAPGQSVSPAPASTPFALAVYPEQSLHPVLTGNRANLTLAPLLYEPLFALDAQFQPTPVLCEQYSVSADLLTWSFTLRSSITFSDGTPLTGHIAADALNLARQEGSRYAQRLSAVSSISGEEHTLTITLSQPDGALPALLDIPIALGDSPQPAGTGPYILSQSDGKASLSLRSDWWQNKSLPMQNIPLHEARQSDDLIAAFSSGDVGLVDVDLMGTNALGYSGNYAAWDYATTDLLYLGFNTQKGLCRSPQIRQAISLAIDRTSIVQTDFASHAVAAVLPVHPASSAYDQTLAEQAAYHPELLAARLAEESAPVRKLILLVNSENSAKRTAAQRIAHQLDAIGLPVSLKELPYEEFISALSEGNFDLYFGEVVLTANFDLSVLLAPNGALNYGLWQDEQCTALLNTLCLSQDETRIEAARTFYAAFLQQMPIAPICFKNGSVLTQWGRLSGLMPVRGNVFYQFENWIIR